MLTRATEDAVAQISAALAALTDGWDRLGAAPSSKTGDHTSPEELAAAARRYLRWRRKRDESYPRLFEDPAWEILLDLFVSKIEERSIYVSSACIASQVPQTTALRMIKRLNDLSLVKQEEDPFDGRRKILKITKPGIDVVVNFLQNLICNR
ncbi:winged helix DNA-binding protein [Sphingobium lactosutens]|uniref:winged helix DNA-binding protein n=1 Tax=Sphingobium lactosutens TaxID=522773 RepID=UPI0015BFDBD0|nr:winged helix DNA-binding protein [Sphingobium lactosutens]